MNRRIWATWVVTTLVVVAALALRVEQALAAHRPTYDYWLEAAGNTLAIGTMGLLLRLRQPSNLIARLAVSGSGAMSVQSATGTLGVQLWNDHRTLGAALALASQVTQSLAIPLIITVVMLFPDGRLPSARWRWWPAATAVAWVGLLLQALSARDFSGAVHSGLANPWHTELRALAPVGSACGMLLAAVIPGAVAAVIVRWRRGDQLARLQLKWFLAAVVFAVTLLAVVAPLAQRVSPGHDWIGHVAWTAAPLLLPASITVAVLRYRLYDIDRLVSRTVSWALVTATLVGVYVAVVLGLGAVVPEGSSSYAVAIATLVAVALLQPVRRRLQSVVDRRFDRARYDAVRTAAAFAGRLREEVDLAAVRSDLLATVASTVQPSRASLWLAGAP